MGSPQKAVSVFNFDGHGIRIHIDADGNEWYCANDICDRLDIANARDALRSLPDEEKAAVGLTDTSSNGTTQRRQMTFINEGGVWDLVFRSRKPEAKAIWYKLADGEKRWVAITYPPSGKNQSNHCGAQAGCGALVDKSR